MSKLIAGYFAGEFGWSLMRWQGTLRHMASHYDRVVIGCEHSMKFLYEDFAHEFMYFEDKGIPIKTRNMWMTNQNVYTMPHDKSDVYLAPSKEICLDNGHVHQDFIKWGKIDKRLEYSILIHARSSTNFDTGYRNWPFDKWQELLDEYPDCRIASVGSKAGAWYIPGTKDLRGIPLKQLANVMASSDVFVSPSSGPGHFASLCGCTHVIWSDELDRGIYNNKERWLSLWNPLNTECRFISEWQPKVRTVIREVDRCIYR